MWIKPDNLQIWEWSTVNLSPHGQMEDRLFSGQQYIAKVDVVMEISFDIEEETMLSH